MRETQGVSRGITRRRFAALLLVAAAVCVSACAHRPGDEDFERPEPIPLHVKNENFLDMNIYVVVGSIQRRLGTVSGNGQADYKIEWSMVNGQSFAVTAQPIGGRGLASTGALNIGPDQMIEFKIGASLRQSTVSVQERP